MLLTKK
jgi:hypothetical protein